LIRVITEFDALNPDARKSPWGYYRWLNETAALHSLYKLPHENNFYYVHRYEDVAAVLMDPKRYSSQIYPDRNIPFFPMMAGAEHLRIRSILQSLFTPGAVRDLAPQIQSIAQRHTQTLVQVGGGDLIELWASKIPLNIIANIVGHPDDLVSLTQLRAQAVALNTEAFPLGGTGERHPTRQPLSRRLRQALSSLAAWPHVLRLLRHVGLSGVTELTRYIGNKNVPPGSPRQAVSRGNPAHRFLLIAQFLATIAQLFKQHIQRPDDDKIISRMVRSHLEGRISLVEMMMAVLIVLLAGYGTTSSLLGCAVHRLAQDPPLFERLKAAPQEIDGFVEELMRYYGPLQRTARRVTQACELGGTALAPDTQLIVLLGAANCDPKKFDRPELFDAQRPNAANHIAFGRGPHVCLGAALARQEARIALQTLLASVSSIRLRPGSEPEYIVERDTGMYGFESLEVMVTA
jgi:cytochrome P450